MSNSLDPAVSTAQSALSAQQDQVLALLSAGSTLSAAAQSAGVHRNTVSYWRRTSNPFRDTLAELMADKAQFWRDEAEQLAAAAIDAIRGILTDPHAPAGVRLKAALTILDKVSTPPPPDSARIHSATPPAPHPGPEIVHKNAQKAPEAIHAVNPAPAPQPVHKNAQPAPTAAEPAPTAAERAPARTAPTPPRPKIGRNDSCPCGSGRKFKRCCLQKTSESPAASAA